DVRTQGVAALLVDVEPGQHGGERCHRRRPRVEVGRGGDLEHLLDLRGAGDEGQQRGVGLREAAHQDDALVALTGVSDEAVAALAPTAWVAGSMVLCCPLARKIAPGPSCTGIAAVCKLVTVRRTSESPKPTSSVSPASICSYSTGHPSSPDQLGWVPQASR